MSETVHREITIVNRLGLHARAAAKLVTLAARFESEVHLIRDGREVDAKSIMGVMMLAASRGVRLAITATGEDAEEAVSELEALIGNRFGEGE